MCWGPEPLRRKPRTRTDPPVALGRGPPCAPRVDLDVAGASESSDTPRNAEISGECGPAAPRVSGEAQGGRPGGPVGYPTVSGGSVARWASVEGGGGRRAGGGHTPSAPHPGGPRPDGLR